MSFYSLLQGLILGLVLISSLGYMWRKLLPASSARVLARLAGQLSQPERGALSRRLGRWLAPAQQADGCGSGCTACSGCGSSNEPTHGEAPLVFHPRPR